MSVEKSISEPIKQEYKQRKNLEIEEKNNTTQSNSAVDGAEFEKQEKKIDEKIDIGVKTNLSQNVYTKESNQSEQQRMMFETNKKENDLPVKKDSAPHVSNCEIKNNTNQTINKNITKELNEIKPQDENQNNNEENKHPVHISSAPIDVTCLKKKIKNGSGKEKDTEAHTERMQYRNISEERIKYNLKSQNYKEEEKETAVLKNPSPTDQDYLKKQIEYESEKENSPQTKCLKFENISKEQIKYKLKNQNYNEEKKETAVLTIPTPTDQSCLKKKIRHESEKETAAQTKYLQYRNIFEEQIAVSCANKNENYRTNEIGKTICIKTCPSAPCVNETLKNEYVEQEKAIAVQKSTSAPINLESMTYQNYINEERDIDILTHPVQNIPITKEQKQTELKHAEVIGVGTNSENSKNHSTTFKNISKEQIDSQSCNECKKINTEEEKIAARKSLSESHSECLKMQIKYEKENENETTSRKSTSAPTILECMECQNYNESFEKDIGVQTNSAQILKKSLTDIESIKNQQKYLEEADIGVQTNSSQYTIIKDQKQSDLQCVECQNVAVNTSSVTTNPENMKEQNTYAKKYNSNQTINKNNSQEKIKSKSSDYFRNYNGEEKQIAAASHRTSTECLKEQINSATRGDIDLQSKYKNISKERLIECKPSNYNKENKIRIETSPAQADLGCLRKQIKYEKENKTSTSALIKLECLECQDYKKEKDIDVQKNPVQYGNNNKAKQDYVKNKNDYVKETDIGVQTLPYHYKTRLQQNKLECVECLNKNEVNKEISVRSSSASTNSKCLEEQRKIDTEKCNSNKTINRNISRKRISYNGNHNYNEESKKNPLQSEFASVDTKDSNTQSKYESELETSQKNCMHYRNLSKERMKYNLKKQNYNEEEKDAVLTNPTPTNQHCAKQQINYENETETSAQTNCLQYRNIYKEQIKEKLKNQNYNEEEKEAAIVINPELTNQECLKKKIIHDIEKETASQTKYTQYKNISKEGIDAPCVRSQCNVNSKNKEIVIQPSPTLIGPECIKCQNQEEKSIGAQSKYIQYKNISEERKEYKPYVSCQYYHEEEKEISAKISGASIQTECLKCQTNYESDKETAAQTKYIHYRNNSKHRMGEQNVNSQNNYSREKEIDIQPCCKLTDLECMAGQIKNAEEKNISVQGKYMQFKNIENIKSETNSSNFCPSATCVADNLENDFEVQKSKTAPIKLESVECQNCNEGEKNINRQTNPALNAPITNKQKQRQLRDMKYKIEEEEEIAAKTNPSLSDVQCLKKRIRYESENDCSSQTRYTKYRDLSKEQIISKPFCNSENCEGKDIFKQTIQTQNKAKFDVTSEKSAKKEIKNINFYNIDDKQSDIQVNKTLTHACNNNCFRWVTSKDYSKPKNFQHLFSRKNIGNNSQYISREESISSTLQGCSRKCSGYMTTLDYNKPESFAHLFSTSKFCDSQNSKSIKSSDNNLKKYPIQQKSKCKDSKESIQQYTFKVISKDEKSVSDDNYLTIKKRNSKSKEVINTNNKSSVYQCVKKSMEDRLKLKNLIYNKIKPQKSKASEKNSKTSTYDMLKNMFLKN